MRHLDRREDFSSDERFANFRGLIINNKESEVFFRSASATRNVYGRMETVNKIMHSKSIQTIINLAPIEYRCFSDEFGRELIKQFRKILTEKGPYIIQCDVGKKRTGFASIVLEMLSGTSYEFIVQDYVESYVNNNGINMADDIEGMKKIHRIIDAIIQFIGKTKKDVSEIDFINSAELYLLEYGFSRYEIIELRKKLK